MALENVRYFLTSKIEQMKHETCKLAARCFPIAEMGRKKPATEGASSLDVFSLNWIVMASEEASEQPAGSPVIIALMPFAGMNKLAPWGLNQ